MSQIHLVVSVSCVEDGRILMVHEEDNGIKCWNQPAGHVEPNEALVDAAMREALEETGYQVELTGLQGIYEGIHSKAGTHFVRVAFYGNALAKKTDQLDPDIIEAQWLPINDLLAGNYPLRSGMTRKALEDLATAPIAPLSLIKNLFSEMF
ncbi:MAG: NUDIX domain-containing protein [Reinekea sp.]|jgi:phosphatase NudJ